MTFNEDKCLKLKIKGSEFIDFIYQQFTETPHVEDMFFYIENCGPYHNKLKDDIKKNMEIDYKNLSKHIDFINKYEEYESIYDGCFKRYTFESCHIIFSEYKKMKQYIKLYKNYVYNVVSYWAMIIVNDIEFHKPYTQLNSI